MKILAADTSTDVNTVAVCRDGRVLAETAVLCPRKHAERLVETVDWVLDEAEVSLADLDGLAVSLGPGSFTGLRIGVATWKGLALGAGLPLAGAPTLDAMARLGACDNGLVCPLLDAKMGEVYGAVYRFESGIRRKLAPERVGNVEDILAGIEGKVIFLGDGAETYRSRIEAANGINSVFLPHLRGMPRASAVAVEAEAIFLSGENTDPASLNPLYLRKSQAELNRLADLSS